MHTHNGRKQFISSRKESQTPTELKQKWIEDLKAFVTRVIKNVSRNTEKGCFLKIKSGCVLWREESQTTNGLVWSVIITGVEARVHTHTVFYLHHKSFSNVFLTGRYKLLPCHIGLLDIPCHKFWLKNLQQFKFHMGETNGSKSLCAATTSLNKRDPSSTGSLDSSTVVVISSLTSN